jgi:hypothetical protein
VLTSVFRELVGPFKGMILSQIHYLSICVPPEMNSES